MEDANVVHTHNGILFSHEEKLNCQKNCMKVENAILTEVTKAQKGKLLHKQKT